MVPVIARVRLFREGLRRAVVTGEDVAMRLSGDRLERRRMDATLDQPEGPATFLRATFVRSAGQPASGAAGSRWGSSSRRETA
ncbi:hypothetical protein DJ018_01745 [Phenylobacterium deserti]|uniref:Uncharacterized protein n=1 Tax=Phenylobacterium deserti TaxID=1914756 RepID=A0A328AQ62_9CAUL|nr:hypothetical protein DJ018_01745 [Phenylobacterium deserti]